MVTDDGTSGRGRALHPKQKSVFWMKCVIQKFKSPGPTVVHPFVGPFDKAKACTLLRGSSSCCWAQD